MPAERTLAMIKPDATSRNLIGKIIAHYEAEGFEVVGLKRLRLTLDDARAFYAVHADEQGRVLRLELGRRGWLHRPGRPGSDICRDR